MKLINFLRKIFGCNNAPVIEKEVPETVEHTCMPEPCAYPTKCPVKDVTPVENSAEPKSEDSAKKKRRGRPKKKNNNKKE